MLRDSKLAYGTLFVSLGAGAVLTGLLSGQRLAIIVGILLAAPGLPFLISAHRHEGEIGLVDWRVIVASLELGLTLAAVLFVVLAVVNVPLWIEPSKAPALPSKYRAPSGPEISKYVPPPKAAFKYPKPQQAAQPLPSPTRPNPLDPYDGAPNSKVAADAIAEAVRLQNSLTICQEEMTKAVQQDIDNHDTSGSMAKSYVWHTKTRLKDYASDFTNLHKSLIYRLGVAERDADGDYALKQLLAPDLTSFNCWYFKTAGDYFYNLGSKLKSKGD